MPLPEAFDYAEPEGMDLHVGDIVVAPLGPRQVVGVVSGLREAAGGNRRLKAVAERWGETPLPPRTLDFVQWAARYAVDAPGQPLAIALRGLRAPPTKPDRRLIAGNAAPARLTPARARVMAAATAPISPGELARKAGVSPGVVKALVDKGVLEVVWVAADAAVAVPDLARRGATLNVSQDAAAAALKAMIGEGGFAAALLDGVTGSGKTEVYLEAAAAALAMDPRAQVLVLLPEIALTQAVIDRFAVRFGAPPAEWHSGAAPAAPARDLGTGGEGGGAHRGGRALGALPAVRRLEAHRGRRRARWIL